MPSVADQYRELLSKSPEELAKLPAKKKRAIGNMLAMRAKLLHNKTTYQRMVKTPNRPKRRKQKGSYSKYLATPHWKATRLRKLNDAGHKCEACGNKKTLEVHHRHYGSVGREEMADLQVLCRVCHESAHGIVDR